MTFDPRLFARLLAALAITSLLAGCPDDGGSDPGPVDARVDADPTDASVRECEEGVRRCGVNGIEVCRAGAFIEVAPCPAGQMCVNGECINEGCTPQCEGRACGDDGCGGACGTCAADEQCVQGVCEAPPAGCGDGVCGGDEGCANCPEDCGECCGDGTCDAAAGETCDSCVPDCGQCCGDGTCDADVGETCGSCAADCGQCCGDGVCDVDGGETCATCVADCGACCGDGACTAEHAEDCATCAPDCGCAAGERCDVDARVCAPACVPDCGERICGDDGCGGSCGGCDFGLICDAQGDCTPQPARCGDQVCDGEEDCATCPADCGRCCGDGRCAADESCATCPADCRCEAGTACDAEARVCVEVCVADCDGAECGPDGCGGFCGVCDAGELCNIASGQCDPECVPACNGRDCGPDGCGGSCGDCAAGLECSPGGVCRAPCMPDCAGRRCGDDGCEGVCGACPPDQMCTDEGQCEAPCQPDCMGRQCGDDGCGGACGVCDQGQVCDPAGRCLGGEGCDCAEGELCLAGECRPEELACSEANRDGLCDNGRDCVAGVCVDGGNLCSVQNPTGVCPPGALCLDGVCAPLDGAALCDDANPCTADLFDAERNRCVHADIDAACSDGNACTADRCVAGACVSDAIAGCLAPPTVNPYTNPTNVGAVQLTGTKPAGSALDVDGQIAVPESPEVEWSVMLNLQPGENVYRLRSVDRGMPSAEIEVRIVYDITPPVTRVSPECGRSLDGVTLTIAADEPATVYYTTDGGAPDRWSDSFTSARTFRIFDDTTLRFRARDRAGNWEEEIRSTACEVTGHGAAWIAEGALPEAVTRAGVTTDDSVIYVVGGSDGEASQAGAGMWNITTGMWDDLPALPTARAGLTAVWHASRLYAIGGEDDGVPVNAITRIAPRAADRAWEARRAMPSTRYGLVAVSAGANIHVFGGKTNGGVVLDTHQVYSPNVDSWANDVAPMPRPRYAFAAVPDNVGRIWLVGGEDEDGRPIAEVDVYDVAADRWEQGPDLPTPRAFVSGTFERNVGRINGGPVGILVAGGRTLGGAASAAVEELDLDRGVWLARQPLPRPRLGHGMAALDRPATPGVDADTQRRHYVVGGQAVRDAGPVGLALTPELTWYRRHQDYVLPGASLPEGRFMHAAVSLGARIYLLGGRDFQETLEGWAYDPETGDYAPIAPLPSPQNGLSAVTHDGRVWAIGGANAFGNAVPTLRSYDPVDDAWTEQRPMLTGRRDAVAVVVSGEIWVIGGDNAGAVQAVEVYDPVTGRWRNGPLLPDARAGLVGVVHDGTIVVGGGRDGAGAIRGTVWALTAGAAMWRQVSADMLPVADAAAILMHDDEMVVMGGRTAQGLTNAVIVVDLETEQRRTPQIAEHRFLTALDHRPAVVHNGEVYLFGGNAGIDPLGPSGQTRVEKMLGRCVDGVPSPYEDPDPRLIDAGGICPTLEFIPPRVGLTGRTGVVNGDGWRVCRADEASAWVSAANSGTYNAAVICGFLGYGAATSHGGTSGQVCVRESYDNAGAGWPDAYRSTVHWRCTR